MAIAAGSEHTCALLRDGTARCWGRNNHGELGDGSTRTHLHPVAVRGLHDAVAIAAAAEHTCAVLRDRTVRCWGSNDLGEAGDGTRIDRTTPVRVAGLTAVTAIAVGPTHTCALRADGGVRCWGDNDYGALGDGTRQTRATAVAVTGIIGAVALATGYGGTCIGLVDSAWKCSGRPLTRAADYADHTQDQLIPTTEPTLAGVTAMAAGYGATCTLDADGGARCLESNATGSGLRRLPGLTSVVEIALGCARTADGSVRCWGSDWLGQLGDAGIRATIPATRAAAVGRAGAELAVCAVGGRSHRVLGTVPRGCLHHRVPGHPDPHPGYRRRGGLRR